MKAEMKFMPDRIIIFLVEFDIVTFNVHTNILLKLSKPLIRLAYPKTFIIFVPL